MKGQQVLVGAPAAAAVPYFALIVIFAQRYDKNASVGTLVAMMLPYAVALSIVWILLFLVRELLRLPYGPRVSK